MASSNLLVTFDDAVQLNEAYEQRLSRGRARVSGDDHGLGLGDACTVVLVHPDTGASLELDAEVVEVDSGSVEVSFGLTPLKRNQLAKLVGESSRHQHMHERLRRLSASERHKLALTGDHTERVLLERIYGKAVWEELLQNPAITVPEVMRLAKMGTLPRPLLEQIVGNNTWVRVPQLRRTLLANPRLDAPLIHRVLALTPPAELKLVPRQTAYPMAVRSAAKRLLKGPGA
jgi:hypothetical protein